MMYRKVDRIGLHGTNLTFKGLTTNELVYRSINTSDHKTAANFLIDWLGEQDGFTSQSRG